MNKTEKKTDYLKTFLVILLLLLIWYIISQLGIFSAYIFPSPKRIMDAFIGMVRSKELFSNLSASLFRVLIGFLISFILAFILGMVAAIMPKADPFYKPILEFIRQVPPMSLIPLLILWFGIGETSKIIVIVLTSFFPIFMNTESGLKGCDPKLLEVGKILHLSERESFFKIRLPYALPEILVGIRIGLGYSFRAIVGAEMIAASKGLGYMILDAQAMSRTDKVIVGIILIGALGLVIDSLFKLLLRKKNLKWLTTK